MAGLLILYQALFFPTGQETKAPPEQASKPGTPASPPSAPTVPIANTPVPPPSAPAPVVAASGRPRPPQRISTVESALYRTVVSSEGGKLQEWTLKYRGVKPMVAVGDFGPGGLVVGADQRAGEVVPMEIAPAALVLDAHRPRGDVTLRGQDSGLVITESLGFQADDFTLDARIRIDNPTGAARTVTVSLPWVTHPAAKSGTEKFLGQHATEVVWSSGGHVGRVEV